MVCVSVTACGVLVPLYDKEEGLRFELVREGPQP